MKSEFQKQLVASVIIVLVFNVLNTVFKHWIFSSIGHCIAGLLWTLHPAKINDNWAEDKQFIACRIAGLVLIIFGLMLRAKYY